MDALKEMVKKSHAFDDLKDYCTNLEKHTKGYMYDSLCFRYQIARMGCLEKEINDLMLKGADHHSAADKALSLAERDCLRFYQILDEAIGEHD